MSNTKYYTVSSEPVFTDLIEAYLKPESGLDYDSSYEELRVVAKDFVSEHKKEIELLKTMEINSLLSVVNDNTFSKDGIDVFDLKLGFRNFCIAVKDECDGYIPKFLNFEGSERQDSPPLKAFDFIGHNKELKSNDMDYSYLYE